jgi:hypothetical protein
MDRDRLSAMLLRILYLRWSAAGRMCHPEVAAFDEIVGCVDADRWLLHDLLADLSAAGLVERVTVPSGSEHGYQISSSGRHIVLADRNTQRRTRSDP